MVAALKTIQGLIAPSRSPKYLKYQYGMFNSSDECSIGSCGNVNNLASSTDFICLITPSIFIITKYSFNEIESECYCKRGRKKIINEGSEMKLQTVKTQKNVSKKLPKIINVNGNEWLARWQRLKPEKF